MIRRDIVVVGASAGGSEAFDELCRGLPADFSAALFIVWHMPPAGIGTLPMRLARACALPVAEAVDQEPIVPGRVYVAPVDHHLLLEGGVVRLTRGPKENRFRPAVDPLFRSAAYTYGPRVIGVILTGALNDGTSGLWSIKDRGGLAIVQDPDDALYAGMPQSALENVQVDYRVPLAEIPRLLTRLVREPVEQEQVATPSRDRLELEVQMAEENSLSELDLDKWGQVSNLTCPECHGTLWQLVEGRLIRFRCRTGHGYTAETALADLTESIENTTWAAIRATEESASLLRHLGQHLAALGETTTSHGYLAEAIKAQERAKLMREALLSSTSPKSTLGVEELIQPIKKRP